MNHDNDHKPQQRWPFDPVRPEDPQPTELPEESKRVEKQSGRDAGRAEEPEPKEKRR
ncbi:MAG TPA: hypothetical protein VFV74_10605 [Burkholderiales bacterium]|nr:hypothetical protein [Burkholderiales bacterium]